jgi:hypothetical protein
MSEETTNGGPPGTDGPPGPALSAEEWADGAHHGVAYVDDGALLVVHHDRHQEDVRVEADDLPAVMALANAALPDGHPQKLTPAMVDALDALDDPAAHDPSANGGPAHGGEVARLRAALRALLPPSRDAARADEIIALAERAPAGAVACASDELMRQLCALRSDDPPTIQAAVRSVLVAWLRDDAAAAEITARVKP